MKAIGITCGIGSMLIGAKQAGFDILGNIEWRKYYHARDKNNKNTFEDNFKVLMYQNINDIPEHILSDWIGKIDLAMGHPECGNFSQLSATAQFNRTLKEMNNDPGDIPIFVDLVKKLKPRFFVQDNLPKSLIGYPISKWNEMLPEYDLFPEFVSNWGYGNVQKYRNRLFIIGSLKNEEFVFIPDEYEYNLRLIDILNDLPKENNEKHTLKGSCSKGKGIYSDDKYMDWAQYREFMLNSEDGVTVPYKAKDGSWKKHIGCRKGFTYGYVPVITGGVAIANPMTGLPFSLRERCRIQGIPDDFILYGTKIEDDGTWNHLKNSALIKQTGKCMPVQFCRYISEQIADHLQGIEFIGLGNRIKNPTAEITEAKVWFCKNIGYSNKKGACEVCWIKNCERREV